MAQDEKKSMIGMKCDYCGMVIEDEPWFAPVRKELLGKEHVFCTNPHELMHTVCARNIIPIAEVCMKAAMMRKESRMVTLHQRIEYPETDDKNWAKPIIVKKDLTTGKTRLEPRVLKAEKYGWRD